MTLAGGRISTERIEAAMRSIDPVFLNSPQVSFPALSAELGCDLQLKVETLNPIRSFKGRGASCFVASLERPRPLVAASAGNFGQGLAFAARAAGLPITVFAATAANPLKVARMRDFGATVMLEGADFDSAKAAARAHAAATDALFVEDGRDLAITEGAGTIGLELLRDGGAFDAVVVPLGNGALLNGVGAWIRKTAPATRVIGVVASGAPAMERSWRRGRAVETADVATIADGIAVRVPVPEAVADMAGLVDDVMLVDDASILRAMRAVLLHAGLLVEPAGAAGVAAVMAAPEGFAGQRVATVLCGANVTPEQFGRWFA